MKLVYTYILITTFWSWHILEAVEKDAPHKQLDKVSNLENRQETNLEDVYKQTHLKENDQSDLFSVDPQFEINLRRKRSPNRQRLAGNLMARKRNKVRKNRRGANAKDRQRRRGRGSRNYRRGGIPATKTGDNVWHYIGPDEGRRGGSNTDMSGKPGDGGGFNMDMSGKPEDGSGNNRWFYFPGDGQNNGGFRGEPMPGDGRAANWFSFGGDGQIRDKIPHWIFNGTGPTRESGNNRWFYFPGDGQNNGGFRGEPMPGDGNKILQWILNGTGPTREDKIPHWIFNGTGPTKGSGNNRWFYFPGDGQNNGGFSGQYMPGEPGDGDKIPHWIFNGTGPTRENGGGYWIINGTRNTHRDNTGNWIFIGPGGEQQDGDGRWIYPYGGGQPGHGDGNWIPDGQRPDGKWIPDGQRPDGKWIPDGHRPDESKPDDAFPVYEEPEPEPEPEPEVTTKKPSRGMDMISRLKPNKSPSTQGPNNKNPPKGKSPSWSTPGGWKQPTTHGQNTKRPSKHRGRKDNGKIKKMGSPNGKESSAKDGRRKKNRDAAKKRLLHIWHPAYRRVTNRRRSQPPGLFYDY